MVDNISKPFTFTANTYAKASEVNADFDTLYTGINACVNQINANIVDINSLDTNKADVNGNSTQRFSVADATVNTDAINKQSLMKYIGNSLDYISGLIISKDSNSPDDTIIVSPGSCYDSTKSVMMTLTGNTTKQNENQGANTTYYVYIISSNSAGTNPDILISTSSLTPSPEPARYRQLGYYTTNGDSKIDEIHYYGFEQDGDNSLDGYKALRNIDYSSGISVSAPTSSSKYTAPYDGVYICMFAFNNSTSYFNINNVDCYKYSDGNGVNGSVNLPFYIPMSKGDIGYWTNNNSLDYYFGKFFKYKG